MKSLLIIGAGQYGHLVKELAEDCGYEKIEFLDDNSPLAIGEVSEAECFREEYAEVVVAIGNPTVREKLVCELEPVFRLATLIHPTAFVSRSAVLGSGCIIEPGAVVQTAAQLGNRFLLRCLSIHVV